MNIFAIWRLAAVLLLAALAVPAGAVAQEKGANLEVIGLTTVVVNGKHIPASRQRDTVTLIGSRFDSDELVGLWLTLPDGSVLGLDDDDLRADESGTFGIELGLGSGLPTGLHHFSVRGKRSGKGAIGQFYLLPGRGPQVTEGTRLTFSPATARQLDTVEFAASGFAASEMVSLWLTLPDGAVIGLGEIAADGDGAFAGSLFLPGQLPVGRHYFTARGNKSGNAAITPFVLQYGNGLNVPGATLAVDIGRGPQRSVLELSGEGFTPNESVSFWLTLPNGAVRGLGDVNADGEGNLNVVLYLSERLPVGTHYLSFRSNQSNQGGFYKLFLEPGSSESDE
ncbi:MAG TPA: hypothetical protein VFZ66_05680 [Herpetosiphonaceae bacterium]